LPDKQTKIELLIKKELRDALVKQMRVNNVIGATARLDDKEE